MARYGELLAAAGLLFFGLAAVRAQHVSLQLRTVDMPEEVTGRDAMVLTPIAAPARFPIPLEMEGESYAHLLSEADAVVAVIIRDVVPLGITLLDRWYRTGEGPLIWYRVTCSIESVLRGEVSAATVDFVTCYGRHRHSWPYVRGYAYQLGLRRREGQWAISAQVRTSPIRPHDPGGMRRPTRSEYAQLSHDLIRPLVEETGRRLLDVVIIENRFLILTLEGESLLGGLDADYGRSVVIRAYAWPDGTKLPTPAWAERRNMAPERDHPPQLESATPDG